MKKSKNVLILLLALVLLMSASLVACNNRGNVAQKERANQTSRVEQTFLSGINEKWSANLSDEEIATLENAGDYVVTKGWTSLVCDVVNASSLQTAKIKSLADSLESEEGKKLLKEFSNNAELLVPMLKQIGLTASDVSTLAYDLISKLISDGRNTVSNIVDRLDNMKDVMIRNSASAAALENVSANRAVLNLAKQSLNATDAQKSEMQSVLSNAQSAMSELIAFAYDTSVNTLTDELYSKLFGDDGALSNVSESELATLVSALLSNVSRLKNALTQSEIEKLDVALDLFISNFDNKSISSAVYSQIIKYAKYAYMAVDVIPSLCDVALASEDVMSNKDFITDFLSVVKLDEEKKLNDSTSSLNKLVLAARLIDGVMESGKFDQNGINGLIDRVCEQGAESYQKAMPVIILDLLLNVSDLVKEIEGDTLKPAHPDIIEQDTLFIMLGLLLFNECYYDFEMNLTQKNLSALYTTAPLCGFESIIGESNPNKRQAEVTDETLPYIKSWYIGKIEDVSTKIASCIPAVKNDLKAFIADYYEENSASRVAIKQIANWQIFTSDVDSNDVQNVYMPVLSESKILGAAILFVW